MHYNVLKAFDPDSFYVSEALAVRSELCTREADRIIRPAQARDDEDSDESSDSSNSEQSDTSRASATRTTIRKKKGKQPKVKASSSDQIAERSMSPLKRQESDLVFAGPKHKPKATKAAQLAAANRALAKPEAAQLWQLGSQKPREAPS